MPTLGLPDLRAKGFVFRENGRDIPSPLNYEDAEILAQSTGAAAFKHLSDGRTRIRVGKDRARMGCERPKSG